MLYNIMKEIQRSYKFRIYPEESQKELLTKHFGCVRFVYNHFLKQRQLQYQETQKSDNFFAQAKKLTELKKELVWLKEVNSQSIQYALRNLDTAYVNFFRGTTRFPKYKSKKHKNSFHVPQNIKLSDGKIYIPKFKNGIKVKQHRGIKGEIRSFTISKTPSGKYYVSILVKEEYQPKEKTNQKVGIDLGLKDFMITSDNVKFKNNRFLKKHEKRLAKAQKHLSRKQKGSNSFEKQKRKVALIHEKIANCRNDNLHKISHKLICDYDVICVEDLNVKGMVKNHKLAKHISDASWGAFIQYLSYKAEWNDKQVIKINRFFPSSKTCNVCGWINQNLTLSDRKWTCANGHDLDRDVNAAKNILDEGLNISAGTVDYTGGDDARVGNNQLSKKPEANATAGGRKLVCRL